MYKVKSFGSNQSLEEHLNINNVKPSNIIYLRRDGMTWELCYYTNARDARDKDSYPCQDCLNFNYYMPQCSGDCQNNNFKYFERKDR